MSLVIIVQRQHLDRRPLNDYTVTVKVTRSPTDLETIAVHDIYGHQRGDGWPAILAKLLREKYPEALG